MARKESDIQRAILDYLHLKGIFAWRMKNEGTWDPVRKIRRAGTGTKGLPDIGGILPGGRALLIEVKSEAGRVSAEQLAFIAKASQANAVAFVARSIQDVENGLSSEGWSKEFNRNLHGQDIAEFERLKK
jgi:hypothetical protein